MSNLKRSIFARKAKTKFEKSLLKATYDGDTDPPKEKHIQTIVWTLQGHNIQTPKAAGFSLLSQRLMDGHWASVLKAQLIFHRAIESCADFGARVSSLNMNMSDFNDHSEKGSAHNRIVRDYWAYICSNAHNHSRKQSLLVINEAEKKRILERMGNSDIVKEMGYLITQLENLVKLGPHLGQALRNYNFKVTQTCCFQVLKDASTLYKAAALSLDLVVERFFSFGQEIGGLALAHYKKFQGSSRMLKQFFELSQQIAFQGLETPVFKEFPEDLLRELTNYVDNAESYVEEQRDFDIPPELNLSPEQLELQREMLETYKREHLKTIDSRPSEPQPIKEEKKSSITEDLLFDIDILAKPAEKEPSPAELNEQPGMMSGMPGMIPGMMPGMPGMMPGMPGMMTGMPGMMPGMTGMMPGMPGMMTGMPGMMTGMPGSMPGNMPGMPGNMPGMMPGMPGSMPGNMPGMMTGMMPNMSGMMTSQPKTNMDPFSEPIGTVADNSKNPFSANVGAQDPFSQFGAPQQPKDPFSQFGGSQMAPRSDPFSQPASAQNDPFSQFGLPQTQVGNQQTGGMGGQSNPFENSSMSQSNPFANPSSNQFNKPAQNDPFGDFFQIKK